MSDGQEVPFDTLGLTEPVLAAVRDAGFTGCRPIQARALPPALAGRDVLGLARTGTGKTAAFVLPILERLVGESPGEPTGGSPSVRSLEPRALVLTPTRELAQQIAAEFARLGTYVRPRVVLLMGGTPPARQVEALAAGSDVVVATVGRLLDLVHGGTCDLSRVRTLVLDEADRMVDLGFLPDVRRVVARLPVERQTMLFSATMPEALQALAQGLLREPEILDLGNALPPETIDHALLPVRSSAKTKLLVKLLGEEGFRSAIVFVRTKQRAKAISFQLEKRGFVVSLLHGDRKQRSRERALESFRSGATPVLVATDLASRGLDVEGVSHVINYDVPLDADSYVHRIGRTGRSERAGIAYTMIARGDLPAVRAIEHRIGARLERRSVEGFSKLDDEDLTE